MLLLELTKTLKILDFLSGIILYSLGHLQEGPIRYQIAGLLLTDPKVDGSNPGRANQNKPCQ